MKPLTTNYLTSQKRFEAVLRSQTQCDYRCTYLCSGNLYCRWLMRPLFSTLMVVSTLSGTAEDHLSAGPKVKSTSREPSQRCTWEWFVSCAPIAVYHRVITNFYKSMTPAVHKFFFTSYFVTLLLPPLPLPGLPAGLQILHRRVYPLVLHVNII